MKGIILAGGHGTRLSPITLGISKQMTPVYDKPLIYYPLSTLLSLGIDEILIISTKLALPNFSQLLGTGNQFGVNISYLIQDKPSGIAEALVIGSDFIAKDDVALILGDNIFISESLNKDITNNFDGGSKIFLSKVNDPQRYGVVEFEGNSIKDIYEKPSSFVSNYAVTGLYFYDYSCVELAKSLTPSKRGEIEITDLNKIYLTKNKMKYHVLESNSIWMDAGTFSSLLDSSNLIASMQERNGILFGSPEIAALKSGLISKEELGNQMRNNASNEYFQKILHELS